MGIIQHFRDEAGDDEIEDDGPLFGGSERIEELKSKLERAKEIASGLVMGTFERDEEVLELVRKIQNGEINGN